MKNILIIGGTGMLRKATEYFIKKGYQVTIVARNLSNLKSIQDKYPNNKNIFIISVDYTNSDLFIEKIKQKIKENGAFDVAISWIHSSANISLFRLIKTLSDIRKDAIFYHLKGSSYYRAQMLNSSGIDNDKYELNYREIYLGFKLENNISRWLTHDEISSGVIEAVESESKLTVVGVLEPWNCDHSKIPIRYLVF